MRRSGPRPHGGGRKMGLACGVAARLRVSQKTSSSAVALPEAVQFAPPERASRPPRQNLAVEMAKALTAEQMSNAPTILVVEDEEDSVLLLESAFRKAQFTNPVHRVSHGALAIEYLSNAIAKNRTVPLPALVLLDLKLPLVS